MQRRFSKYISTLNHHHAYSVLKIQPHETDLVSCFPLLGAGRISISNNNVIICILYDSTRNL